MSLRLFSIVSQKTVNIIERFGKFHKVQQPGFNWMIPLVDRVAHTQILKEQSIDIDKQTVITKDNVSLKIEGVLFYKIEDPVKAFYKIDDASQSIKRLALTVMRSEIGKLKLDQLLQERDKINKQINHSVNKASKEWGIDCLRYQILNFDPPEQIRKAMEYEVQAERMKRQKILISEAKRIAKINEEQGKRQEIVSKAEGISEGISIIAGKEKQANELLNKVMYNKTIRNYVLMNEYLDKYQQLLSESNVVVSPKSQKGDSNHSLAVALLLMNGSQKQMKRVQAEVQNEALTKEQQEKPQQKLQQKPKHKFLEKQLQSDDQ